MLFVTTDGATLAEQREAAGVTISQLARQVGVSRPTIYDWEANPALGEIPTRRYLAALHALVDAYPPRPEEATA
jgi:transcriptional regulator with XRE-family HTH domain